MTELSASVFPVEKIGLDALKLSVTDESSGRCVLREDRDGERHEGDGEGDDRGVERESVAAALLPQSGEDGLQHGPVDDVDHLTRDRGEEELSLGGGNELRVEMVIKTSEHDVGVDVKIVGDVGDVDRHRDLGLTVVHAADEVVLVTLVDREEHLVVGRRPSGNPT